MSLCNSWSVFQEGGTKFVSLETGLYIADVSETSSRMYFIKRNPEENS